MNIFVGNLSREVTQEMLQQAFVPYGQVSSASVIKDKITGVSRGFGFVEMPSQKEAEAAMTGVKQVGGCQVTVNEARPKQSSGGFQRSGGSRGGFRSRNSW